MTMNILQCSNQQADKQAITAYMQADRVQQQQDSETDQKRSFLASQTQLLSSASLTHMPLRDEQYWLHCSEHMHGENR